MTTRPTLPTRQPWRLALMTGAAALALGACHPQTQAVSSAPAPQAALPLTTASAPPIVAAPDAGALPPAPPVSVRYVQNPTDAYAYADYADAANAGFGDAPPDYAFDYEGGERPWVWQGDDNSVRIAEPLSGGGERYYYYRPGADTPYYVRDPDGSYGYDGGALVAVYDVDGRLIGGAGARQTDAASRFLYRARALFEAAHQRQREAVAEQNWAARRAAISAEQARFDQQQASDADWRAFHQTHAQQETNDWAAERYRREAEAARYAQQQNDQQQAERDWQAARVAQAVAAALGAAPQPSGQGHGPFGFRHDQGQGPQTASASPPPPPPFGQPDHGPHVGQSGAPPSVNPAAAAAAAAAQAQAQAAAQHQAQIQAEQAANAQAAAAAQAAKARDAQIFAQHQGQVQAAQAAAAQAAAARQAQILAAQHQAQLQASQAAAARQAQILAAQHQAQLQAGQTAAAQATAARQAQLQAQILAQHQAQVQAAAAAANAQAAARAAQEKAMLANKTTN
ncbi:MAG TPA: hypothetical protein VKU90_06560 [Caulobacteraceae bacterium]|nr:hypothetical protein [Caulobacteraceae bacterium]